MLVKLEIFPQNFGVKIKKYVKPPPTLPKTNMEAGPHKRNSSEPIPVFELIFELVLGGSSQDL